VLLLLVKVKAKQLLYKPGQALWLQEVEAHRFQNSQPYAPAAITLQEKILTLIFVKRLSQTQGHSAAGRII